jgi:hypothetical protein
MQSAGISSRQGAKRIAPIHKGAAEYAIALLATRTGYSALRRSLIGPQLNFTTLGKVPLPLSIWTA